MYACPLLLLSSIREMYWPIGGRKLAKNCYHKCVLRRRLKGKIVAPIMCNLTSERLRPGYPFESTASIMPAQLLAPVIKVADVS